MTSILPIVGAAVGASKPLKELAPQFVQNVTRTGLNQSAFANAINQEVRGIQSLGFG